MNRVGYGAMQLAGPNVWGRPDDPESARRVLRPFPEGIIVGNKVGAGRGPGRSWIITDHPDTVRRQVHEALADLGTEVSELTYLRLGGDGPAPPGDVPLEDSLGFNLLDRSGVQVLADCEAQGIMFVPYFPLASGRLTSYGELTGPAERLGATRAQVALAWLLRRSPAIVVIGPRRRATAEQPCRPSRVHNFGYTTGAAADHLPASRAYDHASAYAAGPRLANADRVSRHLSLVTLKITKRRSCRATPFNLPSMIYTIEVMYEIDLEPEVEAWLLALPYGHYQRVMRNVDDYLVTGGLPDGDHVKKLQDVEGVYELRVALDRTTWRITFWKPGGQLIILLTFFRKTRDGTQRADVGRAVRAMNTCRAEHDKTISHDFERSE